MRVISGKCRGTKLLAPEGNNTRPTTDRIKETLFNIIQFKIMDCTFLDLYSGSGAIGIEALSRGAKEANFVEHNVDAQKIIEENLKKTKLQNNAKLYKLDINKALNELTKNQKSFDIVFIDPPYYDEQLENVVTILIKNNILHQESLLIIENATDAPALQNESLVLTKSKSYKTTTLNFYERI
ncbi:MAG: 16S rRNA (guanine(966)-N(2))-methyltransferase RsmD [Epulopiscium sp. Nele67-Bin005]|nr:MAG: 16S rRNA (guanine(966)-N(2))-methyltransferase RsmD [Epulopiscium sp. Nele67-Bin005]